MAKQIAEKDKYVLMGQFRGTSANVISLGAYNIPQGSVVVTAGGVTLAEGTDYSVDYSGGEVTILNQSIIDAGTSVNVSLESNTDYAQERKTMFGLNWEYDISEELPALRYVPASLRAAAHQQGEHGFGTAQQHHLGTQHKLEEGEPMAHQHAGQDTIAAPYAAFVNIVLRRVCTTHRRSESRNAGQRIVH